MKCYIVALVAITVFAACYNGLPMEHEGRYMWIPDTNGKMHHVDLHDDTPTVRFEPEEDIVYILFTRQNPTEGQIIKKGDTQSLDESNFDFTKPVKFTVHGWNGGPGSSANHKIREAFLDVMEANIITVDWSVGANDGYVAASKNVLTAAASVGDFIDWLNTLGVSFSDIHLTGHSLGGQLVGIAARSCTRGLVEYVTGMDPAHPSWTSTSERIRKTDGKYVEIIHTNAAMLGMMDAAGHNDFYANGGKMQVGCADMNCSHGRAVDYMAYSISSEKFAAVQCDTVEEAVAGLANCTATGRLSLGGISIKPEIGIFALNTDSEPPYYLGSTQQ